MNINDAFSFVDHFKKRPVQAILAVLVLCGVVGAVSFSNQFGGRLAQVKPGDKAPATTSAASAFSDGFVNNSQMALDQIRRDTFENLARSVREGDLIGFLSLVDARHFREQVFGMAGVGLEDGSRDVGAAIEKYVCEFLTICHIGANRMFKDIAKLEFLSLDGSGFDDNLVVVRAKLTFASGETTTSEFFYDRTVYKFSSALG